jgi:hypothetical protein
MNKLPPSLQNTSMDSHTHPVLFGSQYTDIFCLWYPQNRKRNANLTRQPYYVVYNNDIKIMHIFLGGITLLNLRDICDAATSEIRMPQLSCYLWCEIKTLKYFHTGFN